MKKQHDPVNNTGITGQQKLFMRKNILFPVLILSVLLLSSCSTAPFTGLQDIRCARLIIKTDQISITHETVKESSIPVITDTKDTIIGKDITENTIIAIKPSETRKTDEDTDMSGIDYTDYTEYDEDKIVDLDDEPVFPAQPSEPQETYKEAEDKIVAQDDGPAVVSAHPSETPETVEEAVKETAVEEIKGPEAYIKLAAAYSNEGKYKDALGAYKKASGMLASDDPEIHYNLGLTYLMLDDRDSALKEYKILKGKDLLRADTLYRKTVEKILSEKDNEFTVQVAAYKNINYAYKTIKRLQKNYIHAYIKKENNFNKVRVPGIKTRKDGEAMIKELRKTFGLRAVLLNAQQYP